MNKSSLVEQAQSIQQLLCKYTNKRCTQATELVLLYQFVQIDTEKFEDQTEMLPVNESVFQT